MSFFQVVFQSLIISFACSMDCLISGFAYGANKIKIPFCSAILLNAICCFMLGLSLFFGTIIGQYTSLLLTQVLCTAVLVVLGLLKIFDSYIKNYIKRKQCLKKELFFSFLNLNFILNVFASPEKADVNKNKILSCSEACTLAAALSFDGLAVGLSTGLSLTNTAGYIITCASSFTVGLFFLLIGGMLGNKIAKKTTINLGWISGLLLITLAVFKIFI